MNLARYMQHVDRNGVVSYKYAPPPDAVEAGVVKPKSRFMERDAAARQRTGLEAH